MSEIKSAPRVKRLLKTTRQPNLCLNELANQWAYIVITYGLLLVLGVTLFPYDFFFKEVANRFNYQLLITGSSKSIDLSDILANVLLFLPLGFGLTSLMHTKKLVGAATLGVILAAGAGLSFTVEILQIFLPSRTPSFSDVLTNSLGAFLGYLCFRLWGGTILTQASALVEKSKNYLSVKNLTIGFIGYISLTFLVSIPLQYATNRAMKLSNWDQTFPLLLGNEQTGDRPWRGQIFEVSIAARALSKEEVAHAFSEVGLSASSEAPLLASYRLTGEGNYIDHTGHLPALSPKGDSPGTQDGSGISLTADHWLETATPAAFITQKLRETSQFTLITTVAAADTTQTGPARIVSLSRDAHHRNFTLGQEGTNLIFRLRTPFTGENGKKPEHVFPNVFVNTNPHHLIVTYDGVAIILYVDGVQHPCSIERNPGTALFSYLSPLKACNMMGYQTLYYGIIFIPLGLFLALIAANLRKGFIFHILLIGGGILLPALLLEGVLVNVSGKAIRPENLLLSIAIMTGSKLLFKAQIACLGTK